MSDIRVQSIFLDEEFIYEDNSDVRNQYAGVKADARKASEEGHKYGKGYVKNSKKEREHTSAKSGRSSLADTMGQSVQAKKINDNLNRNSERNRKLNDKDRSKEREDRIKSKQESALMNMIEII